MFRNRVVRVTRLFLVVLMMSSPLAAATFVVNTTNDVSDATPDGTCDSCSLREAIEEANALAGADVITLPAGTYTLTLAGTGENASATGDLDITQTLTINGAGAAVTIVDANNIDRVFQIATTGAVAFHDLTIQNGNPGAVNGGGILAASPNVTIDQCIVVGNTAANGGGVHVAAGALTLQNSRILGNAALNGGGIGVQAASSATIADSTISGNTSTGAGAGAGIANFGTLTVTGSLINGNTCAACGGAGYNGSGTLTMTNTTVAVNTADQDGGGLLIDSGTSTLNNVTISGNSTTSGTGGGIVNIAATVSVQNTILSGNTDSGGTAPDCFGTLNSLGYNLIEDTAGCTVSGDLTGNITGISPKLGPLFNNGGPTYTQALLASSPAISAANNATAEATDQRGLARPQQTTADIGAFEFSCPAWIQILPQVSTSGIVVDPSTPGTVYASGYGQGVFKSTDGGVSWTPKNNGIPFLNTRGIAVHPTNPQILFVTTNYDLFKSTDGGDNWTSLGSNSADFVVIDPVDPQNVYTNAFTFRRSTDGGATWNTSTTGLTEFPLDLEIDPVAHETLYVSTTGGIFKSTDRGGTWAPIGTGLPAEYIYSIAVDPNIPSRFYAGANVSGVYRSTDSGATWTTTNSGLTGSLSVAVDPRNSAVYATSQYQGILRSPDGGQTWQLIQSGYLSNFPNVLAIDPFDPINVYAGDNINGVFQLQPSGAYCDDFEDGDAVDWIPTKGTWTVNAGELTGNVEKKGDNVAPFTGPCSDCTFEADITLSTAEVRGSLLGWYVDKKNAVEVTLMPDKSKVLLKQKSDGIAVVKQKFVTTINAGQTYHVAIRYDGAAFTVYLNREVLLTVNTTVPPSGGVAFRVKSTTGLPLTASFKEVIAY